jgi:hypothetical protein
MNEISMHYSVSYIHCMKMSNMLVTSRMCVCVCVCVCLSKMSCAIFKFCVCYEKIILLEIILCTLSVKRLPEK